MQIQQIKISNMIGSRRADIQLSQPVTLFCGPNGASKSSIQEAIRMAFTGKTLRVALKKEYPLLVSEGAKTGKAIVVTDAGTATFELPSGTHTLDGDLQLGLPDSLEYVLNAQAFASMTPEARRTFLFALTGCNVTSAEVKRRLIEKNCVEVKADMTMPLLRSGFPPAAEFAAKKATEAKGAWRGLTGEAWGNKKADGWEAEKPEVNLSDISLAASALEDIDAEGAALSEKLGGIKATQAAADAIASEVATKTFAASKLTRAKEKLVIDEASLESYEKVVTELTNKAGTTRKEGLIHDLARFLDGINFGSPDVAAEATQLIARYQQAHGSISGDGDTDAAAKLPANIKSRDMMLIAVTNSKRDVASAAAAHEWVKQNPVANADDTTAELISIQTKMADLRIERTAAVQAHSDMAALAQRAASADTTTADAATHNVDVMQWLAIAECLAPDGIPAEMLAQALRPINVAMKESSIATGWRQPAISADMAITADGRPYALLSKSEKWRVDAIIAEAIAQLSEVRILMLDEVDILELSARAELLFWLSDRAYDGGLNNVLLFGTLKKVPTGLPDNIEAIWLENGVIPAQEEAEAQAA